MFVAYFFHGRSRNTKDANNVAYMDKYTGKDIVVKSNHTSHNETENTRSKKGRHKSYWKPGRSGWGRIYCFLQDARSCIQISSTIRLALSFCNDPVEIRFIDLTTISVYKWYKSEIKWHIVKNIATI